jgi:DNA-directed RNA polymerase specialized sigma24 family protein
MRYFARDPDELPQAISLAFTALMGRVDLDQVRRVAATLVHSTDRVVMERRRRVLGKLAYEADDVAAPRVEELASELAVGDSTSALSLAGKIADLRRQLLPVVGTDADLVLAVLVLDVDQREAAARLGLGYAVARKRLQRALLRIRAHLEPLAGPTTTQLSPASSVNSAVPDPDEESD